jgi:hypothetical protein
VDLAARLAPLAMPPIVCLSPAADVSAGGETDHDQLCSSGQKPIFGAIIKLVNARYQETYLAKPHRKPWRPAIHKST